MLEALWSEGSCIFYLQKGLDKTILRLERNLELSVDPCQQAVDVGFLSVCCEYVFLPLANKEASLAYDRAE